MPRHKVADGLVRERPRLFVASTRSGEAGEGYAGVETHVVQVAMPDVWQCGLRPDERPEDPDSKGLFMCARQLLPDFESFLTTKLHTLASLQLNRWWDLVDRI